MGYSPMLVVATVQSRHEVTIQDEKRQSHTAGSAFDFFILDHLLWKFFNPGTVLKPTLGQPFQFAATFKHAHKILYPVD